MVKFSRNYICDHVIIQMLTYNEFITVVYEEINKQYFLNFLVLVSKYSKYH